MNNLFQMIDKLPDDLIKVLEYEWNVVKCGSVYIVKPNKINIPPKILEHFVINSGYNSKYFRRIGFYPETGILRKTIVSRSDKFHYYSWIYFANGDILYRADPDLITESREHIMFKHTGEIKKYN
jgi:hypothetical protein